MISKSLVINPLENKLLFEDRTIKSKSNKKLVKWSVGSVCASERRRFNKQKSHSDLSPFVAGHESVGRIEGEESLYILLPHSNCITRGDKTQCSSCATGEYNLCKCMNHAGLASSEPGGLSQYANVAKSQLLKCEDLKPEYAVFTEPLACVIRSWKKTEECSKKKIGVIGAGPIGCLHFLYGKIKEPDSEFYIFEEDEARVKTFEKVFSDFDYVMNADVSNLDFTIMANSVSKGFEKSKEILRKDGALVLFSGFNEVNYNSEGFFPEFIHREEFNFYDDHIFLFGSSGYQRDDLEDSMKTLKDNPQFQKIITGKVYGIDSRKLESTYSKDEICKNPVLIEDISGNLSHHIKIQYFLNDSEK